jgi:microsomal epoxide hydrolase
MTPQPFTLAVPAAAIADLRERLARTRLPDQAPGPAWAYGTDVAYLRELVAYWRDTFDWRAQEARLNAFPQYKVPLHDIDLHFLHVEGQGPAPCPLLLSHGWPGSVFEFLELIPPASAAMRPTPSRSSRPRCPATACRLRPGSGASGSRPSASALPI